jgi:hypothetical protein
VVAVCLTAICVEARAEQSDRQEGPIVLVVVPGSDVDPERARAAIERELGERVVLFHNSESRSARRMFNIAPYYGQRHLFTYASPVSGRHWRTMELDQDPDEALLAIAQLARNWVQPPPPPPPPRCECLCEAECQCDCAYDPDSGCQCRFECPPPPAPEPAPELEAPIVVARARSMADHWALSLYTLEVVNDIAISTRVELGASYRIRFLAFGLSANVNSFPLRSWRDTVTTVNSSFQAEIEVRWSIRRVIAELGLGVGLRLHHRSDTFDKELALSPVGRLQLALVIPLARYVDAVIRSDVTTTFVRPEFADRLDRWGELQSSLWEIGIGLGMRAHF